MPMVDRASLKSALAATLVKNSDHYGAFELVFDVFFGGLRIGADAQAGQAADGQGADGVAADGQGAAGNGAGPGRSVVAMLSDAELADLLLRAVLTGDQMLIRAVAAEAVTRYAGFEPGRAVAGVYYLYRTLRQLDLDALLERLLASADSAGLSEMDRRLAGDDYRRRVDAVRTEVEAEIRRRLVADRGAEAVAGTLRRPLPEDADFLHVSQEQLVAIRQAVQLLGRKLAARLARRRRHQRRSALDFRRTARRSLSTGGVPVDLVFRKPHPAKPEIMLIADISSSVAAFATFTLQLAYSIRSEFSRVRSFVFVDGIEEVTGVFEAAPDIAAVTQHINSGTVGPAGQEEDQRHRARRRAQQLSRLAVVGSQVHPAARAPPVLAESRTGSHVGYRRLHRLRIR
jgi:uncharacterized protein with von Willebrand factor type A (vWA) domain